MKKNIIITGCSSGIGLCLATSIAKKYNIIATVHKKQDINKIKKLGIDCYKLDLANQSSIIDTIAIILKKYHNIYTIIHNGAYGQPGALMDINRKTLEQQFAVNLFGVHQLTNLLLPNLLQQSSAKIIYISSVLGLVAAPLKGCYTASKFALEGLAQTLRLELQRTNIKVAIIEPGPIESNFRLNAYNAFKKNIIINNSIYQNDYKKMIKNQLSKKKSKWTLPATAVLTQVMHILDNKPKKSLSYNYTN